jgi:GDP-L-fucose synthase
MYLNSKILIFGSTGLIGSEIKKKLIQCGYKKVFSPSKKKVNLLNIKQVKNYIKKIKPEIIFNFAGLVGGIIANDKRSFDFVTENTLISTNLLLELKNIKPKLIIQPASACFYPKSNKKISEDNMLKGEIERTNLGYAAAKINSSISLLSLNKQYKINVCLPVITNTYGINDRFNKSGAHVIPDLFSKFIKAKNKKQKKILVLGNKKVKREFIFAEDVADAIFHIIKKKYFNKLINIGHEEEITIGQLVDKIKNAVGFKGRVIYSGKYSGVKRKCLNSSTLLKKLKWKNKFNINEGLAKISNNLF